MANNLEITSQKPYGGTPWPIPGLIEAEHWDEGPNGVAFACTEPYAHPPRGGHVRQLGFAYRPSEVAIEFSEDETQRMLAVLMEGDWFTYTVNVAEAGFYDLHASAAGWFEGARAGVFGVEFDGVDVTGPLVVPKTANWDVFTTVVKSGIALKAGVQTMRAVILKNDEALNLESFCFVASDTGTLKS